MATKTTTRVGDFKINYLTEEMYQEALVNGEINDNEIYLTPYSASSGDPSSGVEGTVQIANGGTGATTAAGALMNLGLTATAKELNYCSGATSNLQTQLDGKAASSHNHSAYNITSGVLPIARGGTGNSDGYIRAGADIGITIGNKATAEGQGTTAYGAFSHAEGRYTKAIGEHSHAEGLDYAYSRSIYLTGEANSLTYTYTSDFSDVLMAGAAIRYNDKFYRIKSLSDNTITFTETLDQANSLNNAYAWIYDTSAIGHASHSEGESTAATGVCSHAEGYHTIASGSYAHVEGFKTTATGYGAHAEGYSGHDISRTILNASDDEIIAAYNTQSFLLAKGQGAHAEGCSNLALGYGAHAEGVSTKALQYASHAEGYRTTAGEYAHAEGCYITALNYQHALGHWNDTSVATSGYASGTKGTAFVIGNGSEGSPSNAFRVTYAGETYAKAAYTTTGADYAEYFEWQDGNAEAEDRRGYFVTLDGEQIKIAQPDDYILGIISGMPSVIGNGDECWMGQYLLDEFGAFIYEDFEYEEKIVNKETGEEEVVTKIGQRYKENPNYNPTLTYVQRKDRAEWDAVGMLGVLSVRDDGTCKVNGYCTVAEGGIATASEVGYRVIKRVNDNIVKVVFR